MFCPKCGEPIVDKANFCHMCGTKCEEKKEPEPEPQKEVDGVVVFTLLILGIITVCFLYRYGIIQ